MGDLKNTHDFSLKMSLHLFIIALVGFLAYSNTFHSPFVLDDIAQIQNNRLIQDLDSVLSQYGSSRFIGYLSFALNYHWGGVDVQGYHLTNILIHILNALLVYFFIVLTFKTPAMRQEPDRSTASSRSLSGPALTAFFVALLFVSHPIQTEAVTYIVQRLASLATLFYLLAIVLYIKGRLSAGASEAGKGPAVHNTRITAPVIWHLLSLVAALFAMKTKEIAFTLPFVVLLYEATFFNAPLKKKLLLLLPIVLTLTIVPLSLLNSDTPLGETLSRLDAVTRVETDMSRWDYLLTQTRVVTTYIRLMVLPINQNLDYDYPIERSFFAPAVLLSCAFLLSILGLGLSLLYTAHKAGRKARNEDRSQRIEQGPEHGEEVLRAKRSVSYYRLMGFGILWFFITLSVESSIIPIDDVIFEHRLYLPSLGFFTAFTAGLFVAAAGLKKEKGVLPIFVIIILALSTATYMRNDVWADSARLWEDVAGKSPDWDRPHNNLGTVYYELGRLDEAMREFQTAVRLNPAYADAHNNLGVVYEHQGRLDEALKEYQASVWLKPNNVDMRNNLEALRNKMGRK
jgi:tetratricopeptide (TPR) repeat protein